MDKILLFLNGFNIQTILSLAGIVWFFSSNIKNEMKLLEAKLDKQCERTDRLYEVFCTQSKAQSERTDKLYEMFIDLLKEKK